MTISDETISKAVKVFLSVVCALFALYLIHRLRSVLIPFAVASVLAFVLNPTVVFINKRLSIPRGAASVAVVLVVVASFVGVAFVAIPAIINQIVVFNSQLSAYLSSHASTEQSLYNTIFSSLSVNNLLGYLPEIMPKIASFLSQTFDVVSSIFTIFIVILYTTFLLIDYEMLSNQVRSLVPRRYSAAAGGVVADVRRSMQLYFRSQGSIAFIVGVLLSVGFYVIDLPLAVAIGLAMGVLNMVPYLQLAGVPFALLLAVSKALSNGTPILHEIGLVVLVLVVVQVIQEAVLNPRIMGRTYSMSPVLILLSLSVWSSLLGFLGMVIALPLTALLMSYFKYFIANRQVYADRYKAVMRRRHIHRNS